MGVHPAPRPPCGLPARRDGVPTPQGSQMRGGLRRFRVGHHPSQRLGKDTCCVPPPPPGATLGLPGVDAPCLWPCLAAVTQRHGFKIRLCFTHSSLWPSRLRCVRAPRTACPSVCRHWVASPFGCSKSGCCEHSGKCLDVDPHFSWSRTREWNCWFLGNVVLSRLTGAASSISLFT